MTYLSYEEVEGFEPTTKTTRETMLEKIDLNLSVSCLVTLSLYKVHGIFKIPLYGRLYNLPFSCFCFINEAEPLISGVIK